MPKPCIRLALVAVLTAGASWGQGRTSAVAGSVLDPSGAAVVGVRVEAHRPATGEIRQTVSGPDGSYRLTLLELGLYDIVATAPGFKTSRHEGVELQLDREALVNHRLEVGEVVENVLVTGEARTIEAAPSALTSLVDSTTIDSLPLNGRDFLQLATLQAGVPAAFGHGRNANHGYGLQLSISGGRPHQNNFLLDGVSLSSYNASSPGAITGVNLGVDAVQEFSVHSSAYSAQYGRAGGGVVNAVTRSGGNTPHGTLYYFHRNDNFDARNFFDDETVPEFRRNQFGGSLGGPVKRNRTFFFVNYEGLREARGNTTINTTLTSEARQGFLEDEVVKVDPLMAEVAALFPLPNGEILGDTGIYSFANDVIANQDFVTSRFDQNISDADRLFVRYSFDDAHRESDTDFALGRRSDLTRNQSAALEETHVFSPRLINVARIGFMRTYTVDSQTETQVSATDDPAFEFIPGRGVLGSFEVTGLTDFAGGSGALSSDIHAFNSYQLSDDVTLTLRGHSVKFGGRLEYIRFNTDSQSRPAGEYRFRGIDKFLTNQPDRFRGQLPGSDTVRGHRQSVFALYLQDTWRLSPRLTLDLGMRWEGATVPTEVDGKVSNLDNRSDTELRVGDPLFNNPSLKNFTPRVGLAWDVFGAGRTVVRSGYGVYPELLLPHYILSQGVRNPPFFLLGQTRDLEQGDFPRGGYDRIVADNEPDLRVQRIPRDLSQPYMQQWNLNIEQTLDRDTTFRFGYVGSHGLNLSSVITDANLVTPIILPDGRRFYPEDGERVNPKFDRVRERSFDAHSFYHGLQTQLRRNLRRGLRFQGSYTFSKSLDDSSLFFNINEAAGGALLPVNDDPQFNRGRSAHDIRHYFAVNGSWELPATGLQGLAGDLLDGWSLSSIVTYATGLPTTPWLDYDAARTGTSESGSNSGQRPDLAPGASNNPVTGDPRRWIDPSAFRRPEPGFLGNLGRGTIGGPDRTDVDLSVVKRIPMSSLGDGAALDLRFEFFNLFNRTNFDLPEADRMVVFDEDSTIGDFSRITSAAESREIQFGIKLRF